MTAEAAQTPPPQPDVNDRPIPINKDKVRDANAPSGSSLPLGTAPGDMTAGKTSEQPPSRLSGRIPGLAEMPSPAAAAYETPLERVREILVGAQLQDTEQRLAKLADRVDSELTALRTQTDARLRALESYAKHEAEALGGLVMTEADERKQGQRTLHLQLQAQLEAITSQLGELSSAIAKAHREHRESLYGETKGLSDRMTQLREELLGNTAQIAAQLNNDKVDRAALSSHFGALAVQLASKRNAG